MCVYHIVVLMTANRIDHIMIMSARWHCEYCSQVMWLWWESTVNRV